MPTFLSIVEYASILVQFTDLSKTGNAKSHKNMSRKNDAEWK